MKQQYVQARSFDAEHRNRHHLGSLLLLGSLLMLGACGGGAGNSENPNLGAGSGNNTYTGPAPLNNDVQSFRVQLWENIRGTNRCGSCHDAGGQGQGDFANNSNVNTAYAAANNVVNLNEPATSRMVTIFSGSGHFCWEGNQSACAAQLEIWITNWANDLNGSGGRQIQLSAPNDQEPSPAMSFPELVPASYYSGNNGVNIHNIVRMHCAGCHVPPGEATEGAPRQPYFAVGNTQDSYDAARTAPLINLAVPTLSRFYTRLATDGHRCWDAGNGVSCADSAAAMLNAINYFITNGIPAPDTTELDTMITSRAVSLFEDGIVASGGNRYEASQIALYEFKEGSDPLITDRTLIIDRSGISPAMNLTLSGEEGTDYEWLGSWGIRFITANAKAQASTSTSAKLQQMIGSTGEYSIETWIIPSNVAQEDANIVSYSGGPDARNFTLAQTMYNYEAYNRNSSTETDANGMPLLTTDGSGREVAQAAQQHVVLTYDPVFGRRIYVNGRQVENIPDPVEAAGLSNWNNSFALVLGNEISLNRPWQGTIRHLAIYNRALTEAQINQNFDIGVGQKYFLMFDISHHLGADCRGPDPNPSVDDPIRDPDHAPYCFIYMEAAQFDNASFLFNAPRFVHLNDSNVTPAAITIRGMRIGINGREATVGQAYAGLNEVIDNRYVTGVGQQLSSIGTIIPLENGPNPPSGSGISPDQIFLSFEQLDSAIPTRSYVEDFPITPQAMNPAAASDVGIHTFEEINATMAALTGVSRTVNAINLNRNIDGGSTDGTYTKVIQGLPSAPAPQGFVPAHQMSVTQLAITYCNELLDGRGTIAPGSYFPGVTFNGSTQPDLAFTPAQRDLIIEPLVQRLLNVDGITELTTMPNADVVRTHLHNLIAGDGADITGLNATCSGSNCGFDRTMTIIKATCATAVASAPMLLK